MTNHTKPNIILHSKSTARINLEAALLAIGFGGALVAGVALMWPHETKPRTEALVIEPIRDEPITTTVEVEHIVPVAPAAQQMEPETIESQRPLVALAHDDRETDYQEVAKQLLDDGDLRGAFDALRKHIFNHEPTGAILLQIGRLGSQIKEHAIAEQALLDAGALEPANVEITIERGRVLLEANEIADARAAAREAIRMDRDNATAWNLAGRIAMAESNWQRAETSFRTAVQLDPTDAMLHNNLGLLYVMMKKPQDAIDSLETAVELYEDDVPYFVYNNLGLAYEQDEQYDNAQFAYQSALVANPGYARAQVNLRRVLTTIANLEELAAHEKRTAQIEDEPAVNEVSPGDEQLGEED